MAPPPRRRCAPTGQKLENRVLPEVLRDAPTANLRLPADLRSPDGTHARVRLRVGVVPAHFFVDDSIAASSRYEVQGIDARSADFVRPESVWLSDDAGKHPPRQTLLRMDAEVWAALETGQQALVQPVVEIVQHEDNAGLGHPDTQDMAFGCSELLCLELGNKKRVARSSTPSAARARALALALQGNQLPLSR